MQVVFQCRRPKRGLHYAPVRPVVKTIAVQKPAREYGREGLQPILRREDTIAIKVNMLQRIGPGEHGPCFAKDGHAEYIAETGDLIEISAVWIEAKADRLPQKRQCPRRWDMPKVGALQLCEGFGGFF